MRRPASLLLLVCLAASIGGCTVYSRGYYAEPVVYDPAPVYYEPAPVVYEPAPVFVGPPVCPPRHYHRPHRGGWRVDYHHR